MFHKLEASLLVLDAQHVRAEDLVEYDLPYKPRRHAVPRTSGHGLSCPYQCSKQTRYPGVGQDGNQEDNASHNVVVGEYLAYLCEESHVICRPGDTVYRCNCCR